MSLPNKFFTNNQHYRRCFFIAMLSLSSAGVAAQQMDNSGLPPESDTVGLPIQAPSLRPPDLPDRGLLPQIQRDLRLPDSASGYTPKKSLSWMAGFNRLLQERISATNAGRPIANSATTRTYDGSFSDCLLSLVNACSMNGFPIDTLNSNAGELIVNIPGQNKKRLLFLVGEMPAGRTTISATTDNGSTNSVMSHIQKILDATSSILDKRSKI